MVAGEVRVYAGGGMQELQEVEQVVAATHGGSRTHHQEPPARRA